MTVVMSPKKEGKRHVLQNNVNTMAATCLCECVIGQKTNQHTACRSDEKELLISESTTYHVIYDIIIYKNNFCTQ